MNYADFLHSKLPRVEACGIEPTRCHPMLFDWQGVIVEWALRKGRAALFEDCGLGKTLQQLEWARQIQKYLQGKATILIVAPLAVAQQTIEEGKKINIEVRFCHAPRYDEEILEPGIWITNYQKLHKFVDTKYDAIVLDESSILKSLDGKTRTLLLEQFTHIPYRLCCTATPSPNDLVELANHSEFLGIMPRREMLATFFVHDSANGASNGYRLKGHAKKHFWDWVSQWAIWIRRPSDLGFDDGDFILPDLNIREEIVESNWIPDGQLFPDLTRGIQGRSDARKHSLSLRVEHAAKIILSQSKDQWCVWHDLNDEGVALSKMLQNGSKKKGSVMIQGSTDDDDRLLYERLWRTGAIRTMITKPGMFGFGLNWQHCHNVIYLGLGDSFEKWYQSIRRFWRFGQKHDVNVIVITSDAEHVIVENVQRKEQQAAELAIGIIEAMKENQIREVTGMAKSKAVYKEEISEDDRWKMYLGDCVDRSKEIESNSIGLSVFSPPFAKLYTYSPSERDMGNSKDYGQFWEHFGFLVPELMRITMPGRTCVVHCQDLALTKINDGVIGRKDFTRDISFEFEKQGWIYQGRVSIQKNPQVQAVRTKSRNLMFIQKNKDSAVSRPALADYLMIFEKPGRNEIPIDTDVTNEEWIEYAHPCWVGINETDTLNARMARDVDDEAHLCPLQLEVIRRCVRLWSNPGEIVFSPFAGIGSEGYIALEQGRRFVGIELKESYWKQAVKNLKAAVKQESLFDLASV